jgi:hypothetical protein
VDMARRLLAHERPAAGADDHPATAASRVFDKLHVHLAPLVGAVGVELLFVRSAKLARGEFAALAEVPIFEVSTKLRACLQAQDPAGDVESVALLFGTFFSLIATFIGERLTAQVLSSAWPTIDAPPPGETKK